MSNITDLHQQQIDFAARIRNPEKHPIPDGIKPDRMKVYEELFFNNAKGFIDTGFPVLKEILGDDRWMEIAKDFFEHHKCKTPYFLEISQEFLSYLENEFEPQENDPVYFYELAHYEWLELYVDVAEADNDEAFDANADFELQKLVLAPVAEGFAYNYPVHQASPDNIDLPEELTALIVYRNRNYETKFIQSNPFTLQLLAILKSDEPGSVKQLLTDLLESHNIYSDAAYQAGLSTLKEWQAAGLVLGAKC